jgi:hypothetical protein
MLKESYTPAKYTASSDTLDMEKSLPNLRPLTSQEITDENCEITHLKIVITTWG